MVSPAFSLPARPACPDRCSCSELPSRLTCSGGQPVVLCRRYGPLAGPELLAQLSLFCLGIPFILVQQAFPVTCPVTPADCAWGQGQEVVRKCWGAAGCVRAHRNVCGVLPASLVPPRGVEAAAFILFWAVPLPGVCVIKCICLSKKAFWSEGWVLQLCSERGGCFEVCGGVDLKVSEKH